MNDYLKQTISYLLNKDMVIKIGYSNVLILSFKDEKIKGIIETDNWIIKNENDRYVISWQNKKIEIKNILDDYFSNISILNIKQKKNKTIFIFSNNNKLIVYFNSKSLDDWFFTIKEEIIFCKNGVIGTQKK